MCASNNDDNDNKTTTTVWLCSWVASFYNWIEIKLSNNKTEKCFKVECWMRPVVWEERRTACNSSSCCCCCTPSIKVVVVQCSAAKFICFQESNTNWAHMESTRHGSAWKWLRVYCSKAKGTDPHWCWCTVKGANTGNAQTASGLFSPTGNGRRALFKQTKQKQQQQTVSEWRWKGAVSSKSASTK